MSTAWYNLLQKKARGSNNEDLGEVQDSDEDYLLTQKEISKNKERLYIPRYLIEKYDGKTLWLRISEEEARNKFIINSQPIST
jgi:hypothetical protein